MRHFFLSILGSMIGFFIALALLVAFFFAIVGMFASQFSKGSQSDEAKILTLDLRHKMSDNGGESALFSQNSGSLVTIVRALDRAEADKSVKGLLIRANGWAMPVQQAEEIRLAIIAFRKSGKFVISHAQGFEGTNPGAYLAIAPSSQIWLQETTSFSPAGYRAEIEFFGGVFEKFDAKPEFIQFHEYKNAVNTYTKKELNAPHREAMTAILTSIMDETLHNIAQDRQLSVADVRHYFNTSPHSAEEAKRDRYITHLGHFIDARNEAKKLARGENGKSGKTTDGDEDDDFDFQSVASYGVGDPSGPLIAFIGGEGAVVNGSSSDGSNPFSNKTQMGGDTISKAILDASKNDKVKAIVFRVSSPGGSPSASDQIWDAVRRAKIAGKPVVISMGQYAASGGYYVSANADKIVALPSTLTGSIGVFGGKFSIDQTLAKIGHNVDAITVGGDYSKVYSSFEPWDQKNRKAYHDVLENIYIDFTGKVSEGRDLHIDKVLEIAKGRVWTGTQARDIGLVDELGGIIHAINVAKKLADIEPETSVRIKKYPRDLTPSEQIEQMFNISLRAGKNMDSLTAITQSREFQTLLRANAALQQQGRSQAWADLPVIK